MRTGKPARSNQSNIPGSFEPSEIPLPEESNDFDETEQESRIGQNPSEQLRESESQSESVTRSLHCKTHKHLPVGSALLQWEVVNLIKNLCGVEGVVMLLLCY
jgi:hypothetical protein